MKTILNIKDLYDIATFLHDNGYDEVPLEITIPVYTKERLLRLNREFNANEHMNSTNENEFIEVDEINVSVLGVNFKYKLSDIPTDNEEESENFDMVEKEITEK